MKITILICAILLSPLAHAATGVYNYRLDTGSTTLTTSFPNAPQVGPSQVNAPTTAFAEVDINNGTTSDIEVNCASTSKPSSLASKSFFIPAGLSYNSSSTVAVQLYMTNQCWFRAIGSSASSGVITFIGYGY